MRKMSNKITLFTRPVDRTCGRAKHVLPWRHVYSRAPTNAQKPGALTSAQSNPQPRYSCASSVEWMHDYMHDLLEMIYFVWRSHRLKLCGTTFVFITLVETSLAWPVVYFSFCQNFTFMCLVALKSCLNLEHQGHSIWPYVMRLHIISHSDVRQNSVDVIVTLIRCWIQDHRSWRWDSNPITWCLLYLATLTYHCPSPHPALGHSLAQHVSLHRQRAFPRRQQGKPSHVVQGFNSA